MTSKNVVLGAEYNCKIYLRDKYIGSTVLIFPVRGETQVSGTHVLSAELDELLEVCTKSAAFWEVQMNMKHVRELVQQRIKELEEE